MPKSQFRDELEVDSELHARGPVTEVTDFDAEMKVLWMVVQGDRIASGLSEVELDAEHPARSQWHDHADVTPGDWQSGPAHAAGVLFDYSARDKPVELERWSQPVTLKILSDG